MSKTPNRGFSLIEAAIVLGIISLVIGGIWTAASSVRQAQRVNEITVGIMQIATTAHKIFRYSDYPQSQTTITNVTDIAFASGIIPANFHAAPITYMSPLAVSPSGIILGVYLACDYHACPALLIRTYGLYGAYEADVALTPSDCTQMLPRVVSGAQHYGLKVVQIGQLGNTDHEVLTPPISTVGVVCPQQLWWANFYFDPAS